MEQHGGRACGAGEEPRRRAAPAADEAKGIRVGTGGVGRRRLRGFGCFRIRARESARSGPTAACISVFPRGFVLVDRDLFSFGP